MTTSLIAPSPFVGVPVMQVPSRLPSLRATLGALTLAAGVLATVAACSDADGGTSAPALPTSFTATLNGANEKPTAATTPAVGTATVSVNGGTVTYTVTMSSLTGAPRLSHIHGPGDATVAAGVLVNFPSITTVTTNAGTISGTFTAADIVGQGGQPPMSLDSLVSLMRTGKTYVNVHTAQYGGGEIRGQLTPVTR
jgi:hypothetical protein